MSKTTCYVKGVHCASCVAIIKKKTAALPGLKKIEINLANNEAQIEYDHEQLDLEKINGAIKKYGYELVVPTEPAPTHVMPDGQVMSGMDHREHLGIGQTKQEQAAQLQKLKQNLKVLLPLAIVYFGLMMHHVAVQMGWLAKPFWAEVVHGPISLIVATVVLFGFGRRFIKSFWRFCRYGVADMNALVGMGTLVAYFYSAALVLFPALKTSLNLGESLYFDVVIIVIGFITLGDYLVARSKSKTGEALEKLLGLQVKTALVRRGKNEVEIPIDQLQIGDIFVVKTGEKIAVDGKIVAGEAAIDESMISGEALPVDKMVGDMVTGATINKQGWLQVRATRVGQQTVLSQIINAVRQAQNSRAPIQSLTDKVVAVFVPVVLVIALLALIIWMVMGNFSLGLTCFIAVLVVACPCAMGLATPMAVMVGVGRAAELGILVKDVQSLQQLSKINYVVFDKTGTITYGRPTVIESDLDAKNWQILATLEQKSQHPLAQAVVKYVQKKSPNGELKVEKFQTLMGKGLSAKIEGVQYWAGNEKLLADLGIKLEQQMQTTLVSKIQTPIFLMTKKKLLGVVWLADEVKKEAATVVATLKQQGIKTALLTGDREEVAKQIAAQVGIEEVIAQVLPMEKSAKIEQLQAQSWRVAMVGDGINDSPALSQAQVGIAMGTGTDVAIESASVTLLGGKLAKLPTSIALSRATMSTIKENLFFSFFYNIILIPIAAGVLFPLWGVVLSPAIEGAAMAFSSVSVVLNSLRLRSKKLR